MKTVSFFIILLFSFSYINAQSSNVKQKQLHTSVANKEKRVFIKTSIIVESSSIKRLMVRNSDFRIYLNCVGKVENIKWLFPKINKARKA